MTSLGVKRAFCNMAWQRLKHVGNPGNALVAIQSSHRAIMLEICRLINSASSERTELPILKSHCDWSANMLDWDGQQKSPEHSVAWVCIWQSDVWLMACDCNLRRREILITPSSDFLSQNWGCDQTSGWPCCCCCCCDQMSTLEQHHQSLSLSLSLLSSWETSMGILMETTMTEMKEDDKVFLVGGEIAQMYLNK